MKTSMMQILEGNLVAEETYIPGDNTKKSFIEFTVASNNRQRTSSGTWEDGPTDFVRVKIFGKFADTLHMLHSNGRLAKGASVIALGRFDPVPRAWISKDGTAKTQATFIADNLTDNMIMSALREQKNAAAAPPATPPASTPGSDWAGNGYTDMPF